jgi:hypothetical protein
MLHLSKKSFSWIWGTNMCCPVLQWSISAWTGHLFSGPFKNRKSQL